MAISCLNQFCRRMRRSYLKRLFSKAGYSKNTELIHYLEGIRAEPVFEEMPLHYDLFDRAEFLCRSLSLYDLPNDLKSPPDELFIIGSGPSIRNQHIEKLKNKNTILLNGAVSLIESVGLNPLCVLIVDELFCRKRLDLLERIPQGTNLVLTFPAIKEIAFERPDIIRESKVFLLHEKNESFSDVPEFHEKNLFLFDKPTHGVFRAGTVMSAAIQLAAFIKIRNVYLLGLDIGNAESEPRFYETRKDKVRTGLLRDYELLILPFMKFASSWYEQHSLKIFNCSPITKLPYSVIPYHDFESLNENGNSIYKAGRKK